MSVERNMTDEELIDQSCVPAGLAGLETISITSHKWTLAYTSE